MKSFRGARIWNEPGPPDQLSGLDQGLALFVKSADILKGHQSGTLIELCFLAFFFVLLGCNGKSAGAISRIALFGWFLTRTLDLRRRPCINTK